MDQEQKRQWVINEIAAQRDYRKKWSALDFKLLQYLSWGSILASFISAILIAAPLDNSTFYRIIVAFLAATPAFLVAAESGMNFAKRHSLNEEAHLHFDLLVFRLTKGDDPDEIYIEFAEYRKRLAERFPSGSVLPEIKGS